MPDSPFLLDRGHLLKYNIVAVKTGMIRGGGDNPKQNFQEGRKKQGREIIKKHGKRWNGLKMFLPPGLGRAQWAVQATEEQSQDWLPSMMGVYLPFEQWGTPSSPPCTAQRFPAVQPFLPLLFSPWSWISILVSSPAGQQNQVRKHSLSYFSYYLHLDSWNIITFLCLNF